MNYVSYNEQGLISQVYCSNHSQSALGMSKISKTHQTKQFYHLIEEIDTENFSIPMHDQQVKTHDLSLLLKVFLLYTSSSILMHIIWPNLFLGYLIHLLMFCLLTFVIYQLCPPISIKNICINEDQVEIEMLDSRKCQIIQIPIEQYRGVVAVHICGKNAIGQAFHQYGIALKHPDPQKTVLLLSDQPSSQFLKTCAQALSLHPLDDSKFVLELKA
jgi:hypothetical protein